MGVPFARRLSRNSARRMAGADISRCGKTLRSGNKNQAALMSRGRDERLFQRMDEVSLLFDALCFSG